MSSLIATCIKDNCGATCGAYESCCCGGSTGIRGLVPPASLFSFPHCSGGPALLQPVCTCQATLESRAAATASSSSGLMLHFLQKLFSWSLHLFPALRLSAGHDVIDHTALFGTDASGLHVHPAYSSWCRVRMALMLLQLEESQHEAHGPVKLDP